MRTLLLLLPILLMFTACDKEPGEGGRAEIHGRVMAQNLVQSNGLAIGDPYPMPEHRVYIIYGDGVFHNDDVRTGSDGRFSFSGLRKGNYTIYTISQKRRVDGDPDQSGITTVSRTITISERDEVVELGDLKIERWRGWMNN